jgi:hypothetical protein
MQVHSGRFVCFACGAWGYMEIETAGRRNGYRSGANTCWEQPGSSSSPRRVGSASPK